MSIITNGTMSTDVFKQQLPEDLVIHIIDSPIEVFFIGFENLEENNKKKNQGPQQPYSFSENGPLRKSNKL